MADLVGAPHDAGRRTASDAPSGCLRGLFCGGTLADEAMLVAGEVLGDVRSNIPLRPELALGDDLRDPGHVVIDFGDDTMTRGRAHPMIDPSLRLERIAVEAADPTCGVLLLDLVLGHGAHPDPAPELAAAVRSRPRGGGLGRPPAAVVVSVTGTAADPQGLERSARALAEAGADVLLSNAAATRRALELLGHEVPAAVRRRSSRSADADRRPGRLRRTGPSRCTGCSPRRSRSPRRASRSSRTPCARRRSR